jgi:hypothetical protein
MGSVTSIQPITIIGGRSARIWPFTLIGVPPRRKPSSIFIISIVSSSPISGLLALPTPFTILDLPLNFWHPLMHQRQQLDDTIHRIWTPSNQAIFLLESHVIYPVHVDFARSKRARSNLVQWTFAEDTTAGDAQHFFRYTHVSQNSGQVPP